MSFDWQQGKAAVNIGCHFGSHSPPTAEWLVQGHKWWILRGEMRIDGWSWTLSLTRRDSGKQTGPLIGRKRWLFKPFRWVYTLLARAKVLGMPHWHTEKFQSTARHDLIKGEEVQPVYWALGFMTFWASKGGGTELLPITEWDFQGLDTIGPHPCFRPSSLGATAPWPHSLPCSNTKKVEEQLRQIN